MYKTSLQSNRYMGWTNKDTFLYCLTIDNDDQGHAFRKVVKISRSNNNEDTKKKYLTKVLTDLVGVNELDIVNVNFNEIISVYANEQLVTLDQIVKKSKHRKSKLL